MVAPMKGFNSYVGPGSYSRQLETYGGIPLSATVRNATFIGKGQETLVVTNASLSRTHTTPIDVLAHREIQSITNAGSGIDLTTFLQHTNFYSIKDTRGSVLGNKLVVSRTTGTLAEESYEFEVITVGGAGNGMYRVKTLSTNATTVALPTSAVYGNEVLIEGVTFRVADTLGTQVGDKCVLHVLASTQDGDFVLSEGMSTDTLDWSPSVSSSHYSATVSMPVPTKPTNNITVTTLALNSVTPTIDTAQIMPPDFSSTTVKNATYTVDALSATTYQLVCDENGTQTISVALNTVTGEFTRVLDNSTPYIVDGLVINLIVGSAANDGIKFYTTKHAIAPVNNGKDRYGLGANLTLVPRPGSQLQDNTYRLRVISSGARGIGTYAITSLTTNLLGGEVLTSEHFSKTLLPGLSFRIESTALKSLVNSNLMLNSSFVEGVSGAPINWSLGTSATIDTSIADIPYGTRALRLDQSNSLTGATGKTFEFPELGSVEEFVLSVSAVAGDAIVAATGLTGTITWLRVDNTVAGTTSIDVDDSITTTWDRYSLSVSDNEIPVGAIKGVINFFNTSTTPIWINSIQLELDSVTSYKESDIVLVTTNERRVPNSPDLVLEKRDFTPYHSNVPDSIEVSLVSNQSTLRDNWIVFVTGVTTYQVIQESTGEVYNCVVGTSYSGNVIPGVLLMIRNSFNVNELFTSVVVKTQARFNRTRTIPSSPYYLSYTYRRPASDYYVSKSFFSVEEVYREYGAPTPGNTLSLAAQIYFGAGGQLLRTVQMDRLNNWDKAVEALEKIETNYIVPLITVDMVPDGDGSMFPTEQQYINTTSINNIFKQHCLKMSSVLYKKERTLWTSNLKFRDVDGMIFDAQNLKCARVIYVGGTQAVRSFQDSETLENIPVTLDGCFLAVACVAARLTQADLAVSLTRKLLSGGFSSLGNITYSDPEKNMLGGSGVLLLEDQGAGTFRVRHGVTTDMKNAITREQTNVDIADYVGRITRDTLDILHVGRKELGNAIGEISSSTNEILRTMVGTIITGFDALSVTRDPIEVTTYNVKFKVKPVWSVNWILIEFSLER